VCKRGSDQKGSAKKKKRTQVAPEWEKSYMKCEKGQKLVKPAKKTDQGEGQNEIEKSKVMTGRGSP